MESKKGYGSGLGFLSKKTSLEKEEDLKRKKELKKLRKIQKKNIISKLKEESKQFNETVNKAITNTKQFVNKEKLLTDLGVTNFDNIDIKYITQNFNKNLEGLDDFLVSKEGVELNNNTRWDEQNTNIVKTHLNQNAVCLNQLNETQDCWENNKLDESKKLSDEWYRYYVLDKRLTFSMWLTIVYYSEIENIFQHYNYLYELFLNDKFKTVKIEDHLEYFSNLEFKINIKFIIYEVEENKLMICNGKSLIVLKFKQIGLNNAKLPSPGFDIKYRRYLRAMEVSSLNKKRKRDLPQLITDLNFDHLVDQQAYWLNQLGNVLGITSEDYQDLLLYSENRIFKSEKTGKLKFMTNFNLEDCKKFIKYEINDVTSKHLYFEGNNIMLFGDYNISDILFFGSYKEVETKLLSKRNDRIGMLLLNLFLTMADYGQPTKITYSNSENTKQIKEPNHLTDNEIKQYTITENQLNDTADYYWNQQSTTIKDKNSGLYIDHFNKSRSEVLSIYKDKFMSLCDKWSNQKLNNKELKFISRFFWYANTNLQQCANFKLRGVFEMINKYHSDYKNFIPIIKLRYGGNANLLSCLFCFFAHVKLTETGLNIIKHFSLFRIKDEYWIDICSKISAIVKNSNVFNGWEISMRDFFTLQYLDTYVGPMGSDGKKPKETVLQRLYAQHQKVLIKNDIFEKYKKLPNECADMICKYIFKRYWYITLLRCSKRFKGIKHAIMERELFTTDSSAAGLVGQFNKNNIFKKTIQKYDREFKAKQASKKTAFNSENHSFYINVIFDIPCTICDMVLKRKENAKLRYIYSVTADHYIINSIVTKHLEDDMNNLGVLIKINEISSFTHNFDGTNENTVFNCFDFSEFNDQHCLEHKKLVWETLYDVVNDLDLYGPLKNEYLFCINWLKTSCNKMLIRLESSNTVLYEHKGRLFSGERSTTLINSMMNVFYCVLVYCNTCLLSGKGNKLLEAISNNIDTNNYQTQTYLDEWCKKLQVLGDDGKLVCNDIQEAAMFNESAVITGLILKLNKCVIGVGLNEFLRKVEIKNTKLLTYTIGYVNRSITSLVVGNPEGSDKRDYLSLMQQLYDMVSTVRLRSNNSTFVDRFVESSWQWISKLNQKNKEKDNRPLPVELLWIEKRYNGFGFVKSDGTIFKAKQTLPPFVNPLNVKKIKYDIPVPTIEYFIQNNVLKKVAKYGELKPTAISDRLVMEKSMYIRSNNATIGLYDSFFFKEWKEYKDILFSLQLKGNFINMEEVIFSKMDKNYMVEMGKLTDNLLCGEAVKTLTVTDTVEKVENLHRDLDLIKLNENEKANILVSEFSTIDFYRWKTIKDFKNKQVLNNFFEPSSYNSVFSLFVYICEPYYKNYVEIKVFMNKYLKYKGII